MSLAEQMVGQGGQWQREGATNWVDEYCWLLSLAGRGEEALTRVDQYLSGAFGDLTDANRLLLARSRVLAGLGRWDEAEHDAEQWFQGVANRDSPIFVTGSLVRGMLRERRGDVVGSLEAWREGLSSVDFSELASKNGSVVVAAMIMGSLSGEMTEQQAENLSTQLIAAFSSGTLIGTMKDFVRVPPAILQKMWRTPRGREAARQIAFRQVSMADHVRLPALLLAVELAHQGAFGGRWNGEQEQVVWESMDASLERYLQGSLSAPQITSLGMSWKGVTNFLGWGGVANSLPPDFRAAWPISSPIASSPWASATRLKNSSALHSTIPSPTAPSIDWPQPNCRPTGKTRKQTDKNRPCSLEPGGRFNGETLGGSEERNSSAKRD